MRYLGLRLGLTGEWDDHNDLSISYHNESYFAAAIDFFGLNMETTEWLFNRVRTREEEVAAIREFLVSDRLRKIEQRETTQWAAATSGSNYASGQPLPSHDSLATIPID